MYKNVLTSKKYTLKFSGMLEQQVDKWFLWFSK